MARHNRQHGQLRLEALESRYVPSGFRNLPEPALSPLAVIQVNLQGAPSGAKLDAWIDFNGDGSFGGNGERIANSTPVVNGDNTINFRVPADARSGSTFARFRLSTTGGLPTGGAVAGAAAEDYQITIAAPRGTGTFGLLDRVGIAASTEDMALGDVGNALALGDVDNDGDIDAILGSSASPLVGTTVYTNNGSATFTDTWQNLAPIGTTRRCALGDFDGDGDLDLFLVKDTADRVFFNDGAGTFTDSGQSLGTADGFGLAVGDVDGDGDFDAVVSNNNGTGSVWFNNGAGSFAEVTFVTSFSDTRNLVLGDLDRDGDLDAVVANRTGDEGVFLNNGSGVFTGTAQAFDTLGTLGTALGGFGLFHASGFSFDETSARAAIADLDNDGDLDLFFSDFPGTGLVVLNQGGDNGSGVFTPVTIDVPPLPFAPPATSPPISITLLFQSPSLPPSTPTFPTTPTASAPAPSSFTTTTATLTPSLALAATSTQSQNPGTATDTSASFSSETVGFRSSTQLSVSVNATQDSSRGVGSIDGFAPAGGMLGQAWQEITNLDAWLEGRNWIERSTALRYWSDQSGIFRKHDSATEEVKPENAGSEKTGASENESGRGTGHDQSDEKQNVKTRPDSKSTDEQNPDKPTPKSGDKKNFDDEAANPDRSQARRRTAAVEKRTEQTVEVEESEQRLDQLFALVAVAAGVTATRMCSRRQTRTWDADLAKSLGYFRRSRVD